MVHGERSNAPLLKCCYWSGLNFICSRPSVPIPANLEGPCYGLCWSPSTYQGAEQSSGSYRAVQAAKYVLFWNEKKKIKIVVECLVDLKVDLRKQERSAAPYI